MDQPGRRRVRAEKGEAGELYRIDKQCELMFGPDFKICPYMVIIAQVTNRQSLLRPVIYRLIKEFCIISWKKIIKKHVLKYFFLDFNSKTVSDCGVQIASPNPSPVKLSTCPGQMEQYVELKRLVPFLSPLTLSLSCSLPRSLSTGCSHMFMHIDSLVKFSYPPFL